MFRSDGQHTAVDESVMVMASEDDEEVKVEVWGHIVQEGSMAEGSAESHPICKEVGLVRLSCRNDTASGRFHSSNQVRAKSISGARWHMCQGLACGKWQLKSVSSWSSVSLNHHDSVSAISFASPLMRDTLW